MNDKQEWKYCVVGNIAPIRVADDGLVRYGTAAHTGGSKVYLCGKYWNEAEQTITVIGIARHSKCKYVVSDVPINAITNVRRQKVYKPSVLNIMNDFEFYDYWWDNTEESKKETEKFVKKWNEKYSQTLS